MGTLFTSIGKVLNIKFLLIFLSILFYIDLYFHLKYNASFIEVYREHLDVKEIIIIVLYYLVTLNIAIPILAFLLSILGFFIRLLSINNKSIDSFMDFMANNELHDLNILEQKAIKENNLARMKSYEIKLKNYYDMNTIYLFSFFITIELLLLLLNTHESFSIRLILNIFSLLEPVKENDKTIIFKYIFIGIPSTMLFLFSCRYVSSFKGDKISNWLGKFKI